MTELRSDLISSPFIQLPRTRPLVRMRLPFFPEHWNIFCIITWWICRLLKGSLNLSKHLVQNKLKTIILLLSLRLKMWYCSGCELHADLISQWNPNKNSPWGSPLNTIRCEIFLIQPRARIASSNEANSITTELNVCTYIRTACACVCNAHPVH